MALAARSIRIEAPIPGKDLVGIEIPNTVSEVVGFRPLVEESNMLAAEPADLRPRARRVGQGDGRRPRQDAPPARSPGATGSGKSVCVNARHHEPADARPARRGPADPGRPQAGRAGALRRPAAPAPARHRRANEAKAVLNWAVHEMEDRYKALASRTVRNIEAYNALPEARPRRAPAVHRADHRRAGRPDHARGPQGRGPGRQDRPEGAGRRASTSCSPPSGRRSTS